MIRPASCCRCVPGGFQSQLRPELEQTERLQPAAARLGRSAAAEDLGHTAAAGLGHTAAGHVDTATAGRIPERLSGSHVCSPRSLRQAVAHDNGYD